MPRGRSVEVDTTAAFLCLMSSHVHSNSCAAGPLLTAPANFGRPGVIVGVKFVFLAVGKQAKTLGVAPDCAAVPLTVGEGLHNNVWWGSFPVPQYSSLTCFLSYVCLPVKRVPLGTPVFIQVPGTVGKHRTGSPCWGTRITHTSPIASV